MLFCTWMKRKYITDTSAKGNLARSIKVDGDCFPKQGRQGKIMKYLHLRGASDICIDAFEKCWEEYINDERKRHRK